MEQVTVGKLLSSLTKIAKEHPEVLNKAIVVADDNEGNGYHGMFFEITFEPKEVKDIIENSNGVYDSSVTNPKNLVILG